MKKMYLNLILTAFIAHNLFAQNTPKVFTKGAMKDMGTTYDLKIWLDTLADKSNLYGMGPYDRMKGEIMVIDGKPFFASAFVEGKAVVSQSWNIRSPFFVYSNVKDWEEFNLSGPINSVLELQEKVAAIAKNKGYDLNEPFAFRVVGHFDKMSTHIVTPRNSEVEGYRKNVNSQIFTIDNTSGELLGFYSEKHQGIFTGPKSFVHIHFLKDDQTFMGHLNEIMTRDTTFKLYLPKRQTNVETGMRVNDTDFSKGRLGNIQNIDLNDLAKFHGHLCDGLVLGNLALQQAMNKLYPEGIIDRTNTRIVSKSSPCLTDAAIYSTGARYQFNTFYVSDNMEGLFTVQRIDNEKSVVVRLNEGVKPPEIDQLGAKAARGELSACDLDKLKQMEDDFTDKLLSTNPKDNFTVIEIKGFKWMPVLKNDYIKTDILNKNKSTCSQ
jgi:alpha-acetolactate decarboxylase/formylmethanofuran dehydrogenase subunit E